jgi:hypothetical protein
VDVINFRREYFDLLGETDRSVEKAAHLKNKKHEILTAECPEGRLYKYCNIETAAKILANSTILLQTPDNFNDPFDCLTGVARWDNQTQFSPSAVDIEFIKDQLNKLPAKYRPDEFRLLHNLRIAFSFVLTCFSAEPKKHLMWSHYANSHRGICLEFKSEDLINDIHPCLYTDDLSPFDWSKTSKNLALVKNITWEYEHEWRFVRPSSRPKMRLMGQVLPEIYNKVHTNPKFSREDHEEWSAINTNIVQRLESVFNEERTLSIKPSKVILGARFSKNFSNESTLENCKLIVRAARMHGIPIWLTRTTRNDFRLYEEEITRANPTSLDFDPELRTSLPANISETGWL